jgi:hypothetical protein
MKTGVLKIDKDCIVSEDWQGNYVRVVRMVCSLFDVTVTQIRSCPSRMKGMHYYIHIKPPVDGGFANELQWLLGDDCSRVDFNRARIESGLREWNKLFEEPERELRTIYRV